MSVRPSTADRVAIAAFAGNAVFAGGSAIGIRYSNRELPPLWGAGLRFALAGALLAALMAALGLQLPRGRAAAGALLFGALHFGAAMALAYWGFTRVHAGLGQTVIAVVPLAALLLAVLQREERLHARAIVGALLALAGVASLSRTPLHEGVPLLSLLAMVGSACCLAQAAVVVRRFPTVHPVTLNAVGMLTGALVLVLGSLALGERITIPRERATWLAIGYLVVLGSALGFVLYVVVLARWSASRAAYGFVVSPIVALGLSAWLDHEPLRGQLLLGGALVLAGVYVGALRRTAT